MAVGPSEEGELREEKKKEREREDGSEVPRSPEPVS